MNKVQNQGDRVRLSFKLFDSEGVDLVRTLAMNKAGLKAAGDEAERLGYVVDKNTARAAEKFNDNLTRLHRAGSGLQNQLAAALLPTLNEITDDMVAVAKETGAFDGVATVLTATLKGVVSAGVVVAATFKKAGTVMGGVSAAVMSAVQGEFGATRDIVLSLNSDLDDIDKQAQDRLKRIWAAAKAAKDIQSDAAGANQAGSPGPSVDTGLTTKKKEELAKQLADLREALLTEEQQLDAHYKANQQLLWNSLKEKLLSQADYESARKSLEDQYNEARTEKVREAAAQHRQDLVDRLTAFDEYMMTEQERLVAWKQQEEELLAELREQSLLNEQEFHIRREQLLQTYQKRSETLVQANMSNEEKLWASGWNGKLQVMSGVLGLATDLMQSQSKTQFEIGKRAAQSQVAIDTFRAAQGAYAALAGIPFVGPVLGAAAAAAATLAGLTRVRSIESQQFGGGASASGGSAGVATPTYTANPNTGLPVNPPALPTSATTETSKIVNLTFRAGEVITTESLRDEVVPMINEATDDGITINARVVA
jgi:hypothetical protein